MPYAAVVASLDDGIRLGIVTEAGLLRRIALLPAGTPLQGAADDLGRRIAEALASYFATADTVALAQLPLAPAPTAFATRLRRCLCDIPPAGTRCYGEIARELGTSARAIGQACRANPLPVIVPCHRVVGRDGSGGYAGARTGALPGFKNALIEHEQRWRRPH